MARRADASHPSSGRRRKVWLSVETEVPTWGGAIPARYNPGRADASRPSSGGWRKVWLSVETDVPTWGGAIPARYNPGRADASRPSSGGWGKVWLSVEADVPTWMAQSRRDTIRARRYIPPIERWMAEGLAVGRSRCPHLGWRNPGAIQSGARRCIPPIERWMGEGLAVGRSRCPHRGATLQKRPIPLSRYRQGRLGNSVRAYRR